jgi:hypothetical protein
MDLYAIILDYLLVIVTGIYMTEREKEDDGVGGYWYYSAAEGSVVNRNNFDS